MRNKITTPAVPITEPSTPAVPVEAKRKFRLNRKTALIAGALVVLVATSGLGITTAIVQTNTANELTAQVAEKDSAIAEKDQRISAISPSYNWYWDEKEQEQDQRDGESAGRHAAIIRLFEADGETPKYGVIGGYNADELTLSDVEEYGTVYVEAHAEGTRAVEEEYATAVRDAARAAAEVRIDEIKADMLVTHKDISEYEHGLVMVDGLLTYVSPEGKEINIAHDDEFITQYIQGFEVRKAKFVSDKAYYAQF